MKKIHDIWPQQFETVLCSGDSDSHTRWEPCQTSISHSRFCFLFYVCNNCLPNPTCTDPHDWPAALFYFKVKKFINLEWNWQNGWEPGGGPTAEVITWFCLSWFWFKKGRVCQKKTKKKNSGRSPVSIQSQIFVKRTKGRDGNKKWVERYWTKRERRWSTPHASEIKWTDTKRHGYHRENKCRGRMVKEMKDEWEGITKQNICNGIDQLYQTFKQK